MKMPEQDHHYNFQDLQEWEGRWELISGVPFNMTPAPSTTHQRILSSIFLELHSSLKDSICEVFISPFDVRLSETEEYDNPDTVCQPDLSVICNPSQIDDRGAKGAPKLIVEILSPATAIKDRNQKFKTYEKFGVSEYWIVDPAHQTVEVYGLEEGSFQKREVFGREDKLYSFAFPECEFELKNIFVIV
ncbi:Uma2 family endonuclease [Paenibacillus qinlingensis]|uniref:Uma2 family endonuclease n=1 Tax=Paenibacillus qinlingensis TaxID=1837343 RepID=A0ABU1P192_9BACL|nr:Uma2 family endonuclease [Paenibacillus qinlingensis]MDR6553037.1 Uma2 family endonuclease [Paenibacillus qinlingensis]